MEHASARRTSSETEKAKKITIIIKPVTKAMTPKLKPQMFNSPWQLHGYLIWSHCSCWVELWELRKQRLLDSRCPGNLQAPRMNGGERRRWDHHYLVSLLLSQLPLRPTIRMPRCVTRTSTRRLALALPFLFFSSRSRSWSSFRTQTGHYYWLAAGFRE